MYKVFYIKVYFSSNYHLFIQLSFSDFIFLFFSLDDREKEREVHDVCAVQQAILFPPFYFLKIKKIRG